MKFLIVSVLIAVAISPANGMGRRSKTPTPSPTATAAPTATPAKISGLYYCFPAYQDTNHYPDPATCKGLTNPSIKGILFRQTWDTLESTRLAFDWKFLDAAFAAAEVHGKLVSLQILAGQHKAKWFDASYGAHLFNVTDVGDVTVPWDPTFQPEWKRVQQAISGRYKGHASLAYVVIQGGQASESFICRLVSDQSGPRTDGQLTADQLAVAAGYTDAINAWETSMHWMIGMYHDVWSPVPCDGVTGPPFPNGGLDVLGTVFDYGVTTYPIWFGISAHDLTSVGPKPTNPSYNWVKITG